MSRKRLIIVVLIIIAVWYFWSGRREQEPQETAATDAGEIVNEEAASDRVVGADEEDSPETGADAREQDSDNMGMPSAAGAVNIHYLTETALEECSTETVVAARLPDPQYGHPAAGALVYQTLPLDPGAPEGYTSALPPGTRLITMRIDKDGVATADYNSVLLSNIDNCNGPQRRVQIENTLRDFPAIKKVVITVGGQEWK